MVRREFLSYSRIALWLYEWLGPFISLSPYYGALTSLYVATSPDIQKNNIRGSYFDAIARISDVHEVAKDDQKQKDLWKLSEALLEERGFKIPSI